MSWFWRSCRVCWSSGLAKAPPLELPLATYVLTDPSIRSAKVMPPQLVGPRVLSPGGAVKKVPSQFPELSSLAQFDHVPSG